MFHYLSQFPWLQGSSLENLLSYTTIRVALAAITAFLCSIALGPVLIRRLQGWKVREVTGHTDSVRLNELHQSKSSTPTMGGILIVGSILMSSMLWTHWNFYSLSMMALILGLGLIGFADDYIKLKTRGKQPLPAKQKSMYMLLLIICIAYLFWDYNRDHNRTWLHFPFVPLEYHLDLKAFYVWWTVLVIFAASNAVNMTDGLDGLATGSSMMVGVAFVAIAYLSGHAQFASYLKIPAVTGAGEIAVVCSALCGACLGFLWYNCHPAEIFMGDTGSLPLGGTIGYAAVVLKQEILLVLIGGIFVLEAMSVILQVGYFKKTGGKRLFKCAPIHHHFEMSGWDENKIVVRFWIIGIILAIVGLATLKIR